MQYKNNENADSPWSHKNILNKKRKIMKHPTDLYANQRNR